MRHAWEYGQRAAPTKCKVPTKVPTNWLVCVFNSPKSIFGCHRSHFFHKQSLITVKITVRFLSWNPCRRLSYSKHVGLNGVFRLMYWSPRPRFLVPPKVNQEAEAGLHIIPYRWHVGWVSAFKKPQFPPDSLVASGNKVLRDTSSRELTRWPVTFNSRDVSHVSQCKDEHFTRQNEY